MLPLEKKRSDHQHRLSQEFRIDLVFRLEPAGRESELDTTTPSAQSITRVESSGRKGKLGFRRLKALDHRSQRNRRPLL